jgi:hypothetical protein
MCLLIAKPRGSKIDPADLITGADSNPHGAGIAYTRHGRVYVLKDPKWGAKDIQSIIDREVPDGEAAIVHFRFATHGSKNYANAHPFPMKNGWAAAHNGVINIACYADESDTRSFLRNYVSDHIPKGKGNLIPKERLDFWSKAVGTYNKLALLAPSGEIQFVNEQQGHWESGVWLSNTYHRYTGHYESPSKFTRRAPAQRQIGFNVVVGEEEPGYCDYCGNSTPANSLLDEEGFSICDRCSFYLSV